MTLFANEEAYWEAREDEMMTGDTRKCPHHPWVKTSSDDGLFDAPCHVCEGDMAAADEAWDVDPENPQRLFCGVALYIGVPRVMVACDEPEDNIPF